MLSTDMRLEATDSVRYLLAGRRDPSASERVYIASVSRHGQWRGGTTGEGHKIAEDSRFIKANQGTIDQARRPRAADE